MNKLFFLVLARDRTHVDDKIKELDNAGVPYKIVCGERLNHPDVVYRVPKGKYDAINFGANLVPKNVDIVIMNDVDTKIHNFSVMLQYFKDRRNAIVFATELVTAGPQAQFFKIFNPLRKMLPLAASGELMMIRYDVLRRILPLKPCKAEDTYMMFKALELGYGVVFCEECYAETVRTKSVEKEELYKRKTVTGIYQALSYTKPPWLVKLFYTFLPFLSLLLLILGRKGYFWMKGIILGFLDYARGDRSGVWESRYMD
jgi:cellulose synthase/poly-beta-1,6-N-acetylglucosamine synthase-like glycosyltransferase